MEEVLELQGDGNQTSESFANAGVMVLTTTITLCVQVLITLHQLTSTLLSVASNSSDNFYSLGRLRNLLFLMRVCVSVCMWVGVCVCVEECSLVETSARFNHKKKYENKNKSKTKRQKSLNQCL